MIEGVQKFAARLATEQWNTSYNDLLSQLGWPLLSTQRKQQKLFLCHRILSSYSIIPPSSFTPHPSSTSDTHTTFLFTDLSPDPPPLPLFFPSVVPLFTPGHCFGCVCNCRVSSYISCFYSEVALNISCQVSWALPLPLH